MKNDTHMAVSREWVKTITEQHAQISKQYDDLKRKVERMEIALKAYGISNNMGNDWK